MRFADCGPDNEELINANYSSKDKVAYFNISPSIIPTKKMSEICIESRYSYLSLHGEYHILINPYYDYSYIPFETYRDRILCVRAENNKLKFEYLFETEQLYKVLIGEPIEDGYRMVCSFELYALDDDLYNKMPLIGDFHCHTTYSDGFESPELVLHTAVDKGLDFIAVTDHNNYMGSVVAARIAKEKNMPITIIRGEEIASPFTKMHILSLGAYQSTSDQQIIVDKELSENFISEYDYICKLVDAIHANGGLAVMCHPLWKVFIRDGSRWDVPLSTVVQLLDSSTFDAVEIVSGSQHGDVMSSNIMHTIARECGKDIAYIGVTDSHQYSLDPIAGKHVTLVFADNNTESDIIRAIKEKHTVAIELTNGNNVLCYGNLRLSLFAQFYFRQIFRN